MQILMTIAFTTCFLISSIAQGAEPVTKQQRRPSIPQQQRNIQQLKITPEYLYQQISTLKQQVNVLQAQVNALRSVVQITQNGTTIQAENLSLNAGQTLTISSGKGTNVTVGEDLSLISAKNVSLKGGKDVTVEGAGRIKLKAPQIKLNDGTKSVARVTSSVASGKVVSGSTSVFVP
jgi:TolA-binding protein